MFLDPHGVFADRFLTFLTFLTFFEGVPKGGHQISVKGRGSTSQIRDSFFDTNVIRKGGERGRVGTLQIGKLFFWPKTGVFWA